MPTIRIELFEGRPPEQKAALAQEITQACVRVLGGSADGVDILTLRSDGQWSGDGGQPGDPT